jgi:uncharacterized protein YndB with AHSA1/START domain
MNDLIKKTYQFNHPIAMVWKAISVAEEISAWFIQADFKAEVGYRYIFTHQQTRITGEVLSVNPVTELAYTWVVEGTEVITTVRWKLEENNEGTLLTLAHSGISNYPGQSAVVMFNNFRGGWDSCVNNLEKYLSEKSDVKEG